MHSTGSSLPSQLPFQPQLYVNNFSRSQGAVDDFYPLISKFNINNPFIVLLESRYYDAVLEPLRCTQVCTQYFTRCQVIRCVQSTHMSSMIYIQLSSSPPTCVEHCPLSVRT